MTPTNVETTWSAAARQIRTPKDGAAGEEPRNLAGALEYGGDGVVGVDSRFRITYVNGNACRMLRRSAEELIGQTIGSVTGDTARGITGRRFDRAPHERVAFEFEEYLVDRDRWLERRCLPERDGGQTILLRDISPRKRLEVALRRNGTRLLSLFDSHPDCLLTLDRQGRIAAINPRAVAVMGIDDLSRFEGMTWREFWTGDYRDTAVRALAAAAAGKTAAFEGMRATTQGAAIWWEVTVAPLRNMPSDTAHAEAFLCVLRDKTREKCEERERSVAIERDRRVAAALESCVVPSSLEGRVSGFAVTALSLPLCPDETTVGGDFYDAYPLPNGRAALVVGDVMGKGLAAARSIAEARFVLRGFLWESPDPARALDRMNRYLIDAQRLENRFRTVLVGLSLAVVDTASGNADLCLAGTEAALMVRDAAPGGGEIVSGGGNAILGAASDEVYSTTSIHLGAGDALVLMTDGVTEARSGTSMFGAEGAAAALRESAVALRGSDPAAAIGGYAHAIAGAAVTFAGGAFRDDICILVARRNAA